jgi:anthranilate phosphoribosyltransferase
MTDFSDYIHILARGPRSRGDLSREQAQDALMQLLDGSASDVQAAALLVALRIKGETADEFIGLITAARNALQDRLPTLSVDIDWPCYAGKTRQPLWFLLAAKLLAANGITLLLHDAPAASGNRVYARQLLDGLGIPSASDAAALPGLLAQSGIVHIGLENLLPRLAELLALREQLGVRSLLNSVVRCLNPARARLSLQSVFHPAYLELHAAAAAHFASETTLTFKGDGGEAEVRPYANTKLTLVQNSAETQATLPASIDKPDNETPSLEALQSLWRGDSPSPHGELAVIQTAAAILWASGRTTDLDAACQQAQQLWQNRS